ncbi:hypothetical protein BGZ76_005522 [Entomortierella beljakovae]|nr:hypothetical protein BGZ76_005522 [Entomortierella beljakovae]
MNASTRKYKNALPVDIANNDQPPAVENVNNDQPPAEENGNNDQPPAEENVNNDQPPAEENVNNDQLPAEENVNIDQLLEWLQNSLILTTEPVNDVKDDPIKGGASLTD